MKEVFEKIIERLEEEKTFKLNLADAMSELMNKNKLDNYISKEEVIEIIKQVAEEYGDGWIIPCHCKNCVHIDYQGCAGTTIYCKKNGCFMQEDDFCKYAEPYRPKETEV